MKKKYFCDKCGNDFDDEKECLAHEKKCSREKVLEKKVKELEERVETLEMMMNMLNHVAVPSAPNFPATPSPPQPYIPTTPYPVWCCSEEKVQK